MAIRLRLFTKRFFILSNIITSVVFLLACLVPYLHPKSWWFISFLGMAFPFLLLLVILHLLLWLFTRKLRLLLLSFIPLLIGWKSISVLIAFHPPVTYTETKDPKALRVASWNVALFREIKINNNKGSQTRKKMMEQIQQQNADIVCLQEFHTTTLKDYYDNIAPIQKMGFPYYLFTYNQRDSGLYYSSIIFSKFPIIDTTVVRYPNPTFPERLLYADIKIGKDTIRVFTTHLESIRFGKEDYEKIEKIKDGSDGWVTNSKSIFYKWRRGATHRSIQVGIVKDHIKNSPYPRILAGDLNDVPNSYAYFTLRDNMQDAFLKKGVGIGRTFSAISPTLRIDYVFADKQFVVKQIKRIKNNHSDHYMLVTDLELRK